jgi:hypothetical protein
MGRRGSGKAAGAGRGAMDRKAAGEPSATSSSNAPVRPRRGKRLLLATSSLLFLVWLIVLAWLAFS